MRISYVYGIIYVSFKNKEQEMRNFKLYMYMHMYI